MMKSSISNNKSDETIMKTNRNKPCLSIITTPKKAWRKLVGSTKLSPSSPLSKSSVDTSLASSESLDPIIEHPLPHKLEQTNSDETLHTINSLQSSFKKFHFPPLSILSSTKVSEEPPSSPGLFMPVAPEPIIPTILDWSPEEPVSPPPWEEDGQILKHHSLTDYHSDYELDVLESRSTKGNTLVGNARLRRQSSCPNFARSSFRSSSSSTVVENNNDIISITEEHTRHVGLLKKNKSVAKKPVLKSCQKAKARAAQAAAQGETVHINNPIFSTLCEDNLKYAYIPNVFDPETHAPLIKFASMKPRKYQLRRKVNWKKEAKALYNWYHSLECLITQVSFIKSLQTNLAPEKAAKSCTRRFILKEFFTTEVSFWNQLYYTKMIYYDALEYTWKNKTEFARLEDSDVFANLFDLMQFSAKLINRLRRVRFFDSDHISPTCTVLNEDRHIDCNSVHLGSILLDMADDLVVFLRCAVDFRDNQKQVDDNERRGYYAYYKKRLFSKKETSQFTMKDYLIIPIQRVARYGLLIADLIRHTTPDHPDYKSLIKAHQVVISLATAMNLVQKKRHNNK